MLKIDKMKNNTEKEYSFEDDPDLIDIEPPIGDFIINNITGVMCNDGVYYHFGEVCKLLRLYKEELEKNK